MKLRLSPLGLAPLAPLLLSACVAGRMPLHATLHPSLSGSSNAAGIALGSTYAVAESGGDQMTEVAAPYGEGFARFGLGAGQLELRVTPTLGYVGYRFDVLGAEDSSLGVAIVPSLGAGYYRTEVQVLTDTTAVRYYALAPTVSVILSGLGGRVYLAPRMGYVRLASLLDGESDDSNVLGFGLNGGYVLAGDAFKVNFELGAQRADSIDDETDGDPVYMITPSVGMQL